MFSSGNNVGNFFDRWDFFRQPVSNFNLEGTKEVGTSVGCLLSLITIAFVAPYAFTKAEMSILRSRVDISENLDYKGFDSSTVLNLNEINYEIAFGVRNDKINSLDDSNIVEWAPMLCITEDNE